MSLKRFFVQEAPSPASLAERRAAGLPTSELMDWAETTTVLIGRAIDDYRRHGMPEAVMDAESAAQSLLALLGEMQRRAALSPPV